MSWSDLVAVKPPSASRMQPKEPRKWFEIHNSADPDEVEVMIFDEIGGWWGVTAEDFAAELKTITASNIKLRLSSPGGSVFEGICIGSALRHHPANVTVYVDSLAASIASVIMLAGDKIVAMPGSQIMIHAASTICYGNATDMEETAELLRKNTANIASLYRDKAGGTVDEWLARMESETWYTAEEALAAGLVDEIYAPPNKAEQSEHALAASAVNRAWDLSMYRYAGRDNAPAPKPSFADGGLASVTNEAPAEAPAEVVESSGAIAHMTRDDLLALIRAAINEQAATPAEEADPEDATEETVDPEDAKKKKKLPAFLQPKKDDEEEDPDDASEEEEPTASAEETPATPPVEDGTAPPAPPETHDEWSGLVARLTDTPSPSADDAFQSLKEAWL